MPHDTERTGLRDELFTYADQLRRMETQAGFAGKDTSVRVKDPDFLATLLVRAGSALETRRVAELEAENVRLEKRAKAANQRADQAEARARLARVRAEGVEVDRAVLRDKVFRLRVALHDAIRRPLGVTPDSAAEFYSQRMADEAEARRPRWSDRARPAATVTTSGEETRK